MTLTKQTSEAIEPSRNTTMVDHAFDSIEIDAAHPIDVTGVVRRRPAADTRQLIAPVAAAAVSVLFCACTSSLELPKGGLSSDANAVLASCSSDAGVSVRAAIDMSATRVGSLCRAQNAQPCALNSKERLSVVGPWKLQRSSDRPHLPDRCSQENSIWRDPPATLGSVVNRA